MRLTSDRTCVGLCCQTPFCHSERWMSKHDASFLRKTFPCQEIHRNWSMHSRCLCKEGGGEVPFWLLWRSLADSSFDQQKKKSICLKILSIIICRLKNIQLVRQGDENETPPIHSFFECGTLGWAQMHQSINWFLKENNGGFTSHLSGWALLAKH